MANEILIEKNSVVVDSSFIPFIRKQDVAFDAENLRPGKIARLFFDNINMNQYAQKGNKIVINARKSLTVNSNSAVIYANDYVYQGSSGASPSFAANVVSYNSTSGILIIGTLSGNFDPTANVNIQNTVSSILTATATITSFTNINNPDIFLRGEGIINQNNNTYMKVVATSGENILYVDQNYITANIQAHGGNVLTAMVQDYKIGDLVYQTVSGNADFASATYQGRVEYYNNLEKGNVIALSTISGKLNVDSSTTNANSRIWNQSNTGSKPLQLTNTALITISSNNILVSVTNVSNTLLVTSFNHSSGVVSNVRANTVEGGGQYLYLNSSDLSTACGNMIYFTAGTGLGQKRRITAISGRRVTLDTSLTVDPSHTTKYSIGNHIVDDNGNLAGILNIPEEPNFKFRVGERLFTITDRDRFDDNDYTMKASAKFTASGLLNRTQRIEATPISIPLPSFPITAPVVPPPPIERVITPPPAQPPALRNRGRDPVAQTFFTPKKNTDKTDNGMFITSVDLFFAAKPSTALGSIQLPVSVKIATVSNGYPTENYLAIATVQAKDVKVSDNPSSSNAATYTKFTFTDPVYLQPATEYAMIVYSESPEYEVYIAELGGDVLGADPPRRISEQPYAGSFFRSQNSSTWTPYQNQDLMFVINKAVFTASGSATFNMKDAPTYTQNVHKLFLHTNALTFPTGILDYKVKGIFKSNLVQEGTFTDIKPSRPFSYGSLLDASNKLDSVNFLNSRIIRAGNANSFLVRAEFSTSDSDISPIFNKESFALSTGEYLINNAGLSNTVISITNRGIGYAGDNTAARAANVVYGSSNNTLNNAAQLFRVQYLANNANIGFYNISISGGNGTGADGFAVANVNNSGTVDYIIINSEGSGYIETPTITITSGIAVTNVAAQATIQGETGKNGGNFKARYVTKQFTLTDGFEAGDLRVFMDVVRPTGTDIEVYYKVLGTEDPDRFSDKRWVRMVKRVDKNSKDQNSLIELEFRPSLTENKLQYTEGSTQYPIGGKFKSFAIKIGMLAVDPTIVPVVKNLRVQAVPEG